MTDLSELIAAVIEAKHGDKQFALFGDETGWTAEIGNESNCVSLGEAAGEYMGSGETPELAVAALLRTLS